MVHCRLLASPLLLLLTLLPSSDTAPVQDEITQLPGWNEPLPSKWYSGYINISNSFPSNNTEVMSHYLFIESEGPNPEQDPLILWSNGGPGASSLFGLLVELGPLRFTDDSLSGPAYVRSGGVPQLFYNTRSWSKLGNILMFDWPPPVGFSYCNGDPSGDGHSCGAWNDTSMALSSFASLKGWFDGLFPEYRDTDLFLTGESYAGIFIPSLARLILNHNEKAGTNINLKGIALGDACLGKDVNCGVTIRQALWWDLTFMYGHGQFSTKLYDHIISTCGLEALKDRDAKLSDDCWDALNRVEEEIGGFYVYHLYDDCTYQDDRRRRLFNQQEDMSFSPEHPFLGGALNDYSCGGYDAQLIWINLPQVHQALHAVPNSNFFTGDNGIGMKYTPTERNLMPFMKDVALKEKDVRVLVYNGDADPSINSFDAQNWTVAMGLKELESWYPWTIDGCRRMGGYVTRYEGDFDYLTIRGSGHMVPQYKPDAAFEMLKRWLRNERWKPYDASCTKPPTTLRDSSAVLASNEAWVWSEIKRLESQISESNVLLEELRDSLRKGSKNK